MKDVIILGHLGLGDHFIAHGAIRKLYYTLTFNNMIIIVKECFYSNVQWMFRDLPRMRYIVVPDNSTTESVRPIVKAFDGIVYDCWWYNTPNYVHEDCVYTSLGFSCEDRYDFFKINRDFDREAVVYNEVIGDWSQPYTFVADDPTRNYTIDLAKVLDYDTNIRIVKSADLLHYTVFDLLKVIENAQDVHVMYSSFFLLIEIMGLNTIYLHNSYLGKVDPIESYGEPMKRLLAVRNVITI